MPHSLPRWKRHPKSINKRSREAFSAVAVKAAQKQATMIKTIRGIRVFIFATYEKPRDAWQAQWRPRNPAIRSVRDGQKERASRPVTQRCRPAVQTSSKVR